MAELPFKTVKAMKTHLFKMVKRGMNRRTGVVRQRDRHQEARRKLDETLLAFRVARIAAGSSRTGPERRLKLRTTSRPRTGRPIQSMVQDGPAA